MRSKSGFLQPSKGEVSMKINYPAVLVAAILHWILGAVWYGIFTNKFVELMAWTPQQLSEIENKSHTKEYLLAFLSSLVLVYVLATLCAIHKGFQSRWWASDLLLALARVDRHYPN